MEKKFPSVSQGQDISHWKWMYSKLNQQSPIPNKKKKRDFFLNHINPSVSVSAMSNELQPKASKAPMAVEFHIHQVVPILKRRKLMYAIRKSQSHPLFVSLNSDATQSSGTHAIKIIQVKPPVKGNETISSSADSNPVPRYRKKREADIVQRK